MAAQRFRRLAGLLVRRGLLTEEQADQVLRRSEHTISTFIVELGSRGWVTETDFARAMAETFDVPLVDLTGIAVTDAAQRAVPAQLAREHTIVPIDVVDGRLRIAVVDPSDILVLDDIRFQSKLPVEAVVAALGQVRAAIEQVYGVADSSMAMLDLAPSADEDESEAHDPHAELRVDAVDFSVFAPPSVAPASTFLLEFWAYLREERAEVLDIASRQGRNVELFSQGPIRIPNETELTALLTLDGFTLKQRRTTMFWTGSFTNAQFPVSVPADMAAGEYLGEIVVLRAGMRLTSLYFQVTVGSAQPRASLAVNAQPVRTAFASYATVDRDEVLRRVQGITAAGVDVFLDVLSLRAGDDWEQGLLRNIRERDVFYLFWSRAARESEWVEKEWRYALQERGADYIHPIPLADPREVPPPADLATKHFNDVILACLASLKLG